MCLISGDMWHTLILMNGLTPALQKEIESAKAIKIGEGIRSRLLKNEVNQRS